MKRLTSLLVLTLFVGNGHVLPAYDTQTHREISERASASLVSSVDGVLKEQLGFPRGILEQFQGRTVPRLRTVQELIGDGAFSEDDFLRFFNHFHNPLYQADGSGLGSWSQAGLRFGLQLGQSSVLWQQNTSQNFSSVFIPVLLPPFFVPSLSFGGNWSWQDARNYYLSALTSPNKADRDTAFAETFEALGHLTHLLQDASVPAHVRNDAHPVLLNPDWYEEVKS